MAPPIASIDSPVGRRILPDTSSPLVTTPTGPDGDTYVLFVREGGLWAQTLDLATLTPAGDAVLVLDEAPSRDDQATFVSVSQDGTLDFVGSSRETDSRYSWFDADGTVLSDDDVLGPAATTSLSPDEQVVVVSRRSPEYPFTDLFRRNVSQGAETPLTFGRAVDNVSNVVWSPGQSIYRLNEYKLRPGIEGHAIQRFGDGARRQR